MGEPRADRPVIDITPESAGYNRGGYYYGSDTGRYPIGSVDAVLQRRRVAFVVIFALLLVVSLVWYGMQPIEQRATGSVLISRYGPTPAPVTESELAAEAAIVEAQIQQLTSSLAKSEGIIESAQAAEARASELRRRISVEIPSTGSVIRISYVDPSAQRAADTANLLLDLYLQQRYRLLRTPI
ncbi:MAG: hypothetical protein JST65_02280, partial [Acidobacteria bacterium]|nr:hypothetical protein [Acidobacteriota bacterium]